MEWPTGQERRAWRDRKAQAALDAIQYYLGPGVNVGGLATIADALNPVADIQRAGTAARGAVQPGLTASERAGYVGSALTDMASVLAPVAGAAYADDAARGLTEGLANLTMPADDAAARFFVDEDGAIRAWHGSPHDFDRFSMDKIGTGEGAQAYGHGLYFAETPEVAKSYQMMGANVTVRPEPDGRLSVIAGPRGGAQEVIGTYDNADDAFRVMKEQQQSYGRLYEVNIDANPEDFLDWDAPLSAQPESVRQILEPLLPNPDAIPADEWGVSLARARAMQFPQNPTGGDFIRQIPELTGEDLERSLREAGIPGIRYLDAGSRGAGDGSRNYVVFDDRLVDILGKDGQRTTPQGKAQDVLDLLTSGRASEVTDDMLDLGDPVLNAQLNEYLFRNYDLPMDEASRMARAREMGFDTDAFHATAADFTAFRPGWRGSNYLAQSGGQAQRGAGFGALDNISPTTPGLGSATNTVMPLKVPGDEIAQLRPSRPAWDALPQELSPDQVKTMADEVKRTTGAPYFDDVYEEIEVRAPVFDERDRIVDPGEYRYVKREYPAADYQDLNGRDGFGYMLPGYNTGKDTESLEYVARNTGQKGFLVNDEAGTSIVAGPDMPIRSRFARFDPRLAHLRNLSAGVGGLAALPLLEQEMRAYLDSLPES